MTRILLVDDQNLILELLQMRLESEPDLEIVGLANDGKMAIQQVEKLQPDIVLLDLAMPVMNGLAATEIIRDRFPQTKIVILTGNEDPAYLAKALKAGAQGYLIKTSQAEDLANTIRFIAHGSNQIEPRLLQKLLADMAIAETVVSHQSENFSSPSPLHSTELLPDIEPKSAIVALNQLKRPKKKPFIPLPLLGGLALLVILGFLLLFNRRSDTESFATSSDIAENTTQLKSASTTQNVLPVEVTTAVPVNSYQQNRFYPGNIVSRRLSELGFESSGQITQITVEEGDRVAVGTPLAYLDTRELKASENELIAERSQLTAKLAELKAGARTETIAAAKATVRDLQEQLELAQTKSQRRENLFAQGAISREQLEENVTSKQAIQARLDEAQSQLDELLAGTRAEIIMAQESAIARVEARLEKLRVQEEKKVLKAPFAATVSEKLLDEGTVVTAERPILRLVEAKALEARIGVPVDNATKIPLGSEQKLEIAGEFYQGKVTALLPEVDNQTRTVTAVLTIEQPTVKVFPGQVAKLHLTTEIPHSGYWLPTTALVEGARGLWFAYALGEKAATAKDVFTVERREVEVLATQSDRVLVRGTIREGDRIISNGTHRIVNGQLVRESVISHQSSVISY